MCGLGTIRPRRNVHVGGIHVPTCDLCDEQWIDWETATLLDLFWRVVDEWERWETRP